MKALIALISILIVPSLAFSQPVSRSRYVFPEDRPGYKGLVRLGATITAMPTRAEGSYENSKENANDTGVATVFASIGRGRFAVDLGASYVMMSDLATVVDAQKNPHTYLVNSKYTGFPIYAKYNTFNGQLGSFSLRAGAYPMTKLEQMTAKNLVELPSLVTYGVVGVDGSAYVSGRTSVLMTMDYFNRFSKQTDGIQNEGVRFGFGVTRDL